MNKNMQNIKTARLEGCCGFTMLQPWKLEVLDVSLKMHDVQKPSGSL